MVPAFRRMGYATEIFENEDPTGGPFLLAERIEDPSLPTVLLYGHGDVVRGLADQWRAGLEPWTITVEGERIYGRGTVDNKGQHAIAMTALDAVAQTRGGRLGFNVKLFIQTGEQHGSIGSRSEEHTSELQSLLPNTSFPYTARFWASADQAAIRSRRRGTRAPRPVARRSRALDDHRGGRAHLRPRHRRQQVPARHRHDRARRRGADARRPARLQREVLHRDGRGDRLDRPAPVPEGEEGAARRRRVHRARRSAPDPGPAGNQARRPRPPRPHPRRSPARG